jgi:hypothetical protein
MHGEGQNKEVTRATLGEAQKDIQLLTNPGYGGFNLCYNDNYFAAALERKWAGGFEGLKKGVERLETELASAGGAGI